MRSAHLPAAVVLAFLASLLPASVRAADKELQRVKGIVGYQAAEGASFTTVVGRLELPDDSLAITRRNSAAFLALPDSSLVGLGENTRVEVGAFNAAENGSGATITVKNGTLRFDIRRPQGGAANYRFATSTTQVGVRGTVGLLSFVAGSTVVACLACAADSVTLFIGKRIVPLPNHQVALVSATGTLVLMPVTPTILRSFSSAGVSISAASGPAAATAGVAPQGAPGAPAGNTLNGFNEPETFGTPRN